MEALEPRDRNLRSPEGDSPERSVIHPSPPVSKTPYAMDPMNFPYIHDGVSGVFFFGGDGTMMMFDVSHPATHHCSGNKSARFASSMMLFTVSLVPFSSLGRSLSWFVQVVLPCYDLS